MIPLGKVIHKVSCRVIVVPLAKVILPYHSWSADHLLPKEFKWRAGSSRILSSPGLSDDEPGTLTQRQSSSVWRPSRTSEPKKSKSSSSTSDIDHISKKRGPPVVCRRRRDQRSRPGNQKRMHRKYRGNWNHKNLPHSSSQVSLSWWEVYSPSFLRRRCSWRRATPGLLLPPRPSDDEQHQALLLTS